MSPDDSTSSYAPKSPDLSSFYSSPTQPPSQIQPPGQYHLQPPAYGYAPPTSPAQPIKSEYAPPLQQQYLPPGAQYASQQPYPEQVLPPFAEHSPDEKSVKTEPDMPPRRAAAAPPPAIEPSPVRTKFPTARIKRIMQADEEVGKVAQQTPIAVGKALEMFMIQMVNKSAEVAREKGSRRVTASMLKQVVETDEQWDFLREIVGKVENDKEGSKSKVKAESDSSDDSEPKKKVRGRKKKA